MSTSNELEPLQGLLNTILSRLENIESKVGIEDSAAPPLSAAAGKKIKKTHNLKKLI